MSTHGLEKVLFDNSYQHLEMLEDYAYTEFKHIINPAYMCESFGTFSHGYVYYKNDLLQGFALWKFESSKATHNSSQQCHILLICAEQNDIDMGITILHDIENYCVSQYIYYVYMSPANSELIMYYARNGYTLVCDDSHKKIMSKYLTRHKSLPDLGIL